MRVKVKNDKRGNNASGRKKSPRLRRGLLQSFEFRIARELSAANEALPSCRGRDLVRCEMKCSKGWWQSIRMLVAAISLAGLTFVLGPAGWTQEQKPGVPSPAIRVSVRLVLADAVVTDKDGKVITGLGAQDFTVLEDGKPQKVTMVLFEQPAQMARAEQPAREPAAERHHQSSGVPYAVGRPRNPAAGCAEHSCPGPGPRPDGDVEVPGQAVAAGTTGCRVHTGAILAHVARFHGRSGAAQSGGTRFQSFGLHGVADRRYQ